MPHSSDDDYEPIDEESRRIQQRKPRCVRIGVIAAAVLVIVMTLSHGHGSSTASRSKQKTTHNQGNAPNLDASSMSNGEDQDSTTAFDLETLDGKSLSSTSADDAAGTATTSDDPNVTPLQPVLTAKIADRLISGLLVDDQAFYFPSAPAHGSKKRKQRFLMEQTRKREDMVSRKNHSKTTPGDGSFADTTPSLRMDWTLSDVDWRANPKSLAAIGEYYLAKGKALAGYFESQYASIIGYKPDTTTTTTTTTIPTDVGVPPSTAVWITKDWQDDWERGLALGETYCAIGATINEHYQAAFLSSSSPLLLSDDDDPLDPSVDGDGLLRRRLTVSTFHASTAAIARTTL